jgi:1,4-alpha-glucan branching enzyme
MSFKKQYFKSKSTVKISFTLPADLAGDAQTAAIAGEFNHWDVNSHPMKKLKNGNFSAQISLEGGQHYQFRYVLDGTNWINDNEADAYAPAGINNEENSVIAL